MLSVSSTVKLSSSLTSISLASPTEKTSLQNPFWYSLDGDDGVYPVAAVGSVSSIAGIASIASCGLGGPGGSEKRGGAGNYYALVKNPDRCIEYQQAQQQTEDSTDEEDSSEKIIHLWMSTWMCQILIKNIYVSNICLDDVFLHQGTLVTLFLYLKQSYQLFLVYVIAISHETFDVFVRFGFSWSNTETQIAPFWKCKRTRIGLQWWIS